MTEALQEYVDSRGLALRVDRAAGVLRGVKLIGLASRNGRQYRPRALEQAAALYEAAKVNVNHPQNGPLAPRDYRDRLGVIRDVEFRPGEGLFGDLHFNPKHALAEQLLWDAAHNPRNVGFSHNVLARLGREGEATIVEEITHVQSVDLVADPATTAGLFESQAAGEAVAPAEPGCSPPAWDALTLAVLGLHRPDLLEEIRQQALATAQEQLDARRNELRRSERCAAITRELASAGLAWGAGDAAAEVIGPSLWETLLGTDDESRFTALLQERIGALRSATKSKAAAPRSVEQGFATRRSMQPVATAAEFARAICSR